MMGGYKWKIHDHFKNFIQVYDKKTNILKIIYDEFFKMKKEY